jgi:thiamine biosynthesis lipoprotein
MLDVLGAAHDEMFAAMGTFCHVIVVGHPLLLGHARQRIEELERRWSRFLPDSDISRINAAAGAPVAVSAEAFLLVSRAVEGWRLTGGLYDPTVLRAVIAAGYDRSFTDPACAAHRSAEPAIPGGAAPGAGGIVLEPRLRTVQAPRGVMLDPGGIGKGLAADVVLAELLSLGAAGAWLIGQRTARIAAGYDARGRFAGDWRACRRWEAGDGS